MVKTGAKFWVLIFFDCIGVIRRGGSEKTVLQVSFAGR